MNNLPYLSLGYNTWDSPVHVYEQMESVHCSYESSYIFIELVKTFRFYIYPVLFTGKLHRSKNTLRCDDTRAWVDSLFPEE